MKLQIINIGDELLIGQVINSNAAFMSQHLLDSGFFVEKTIVVGDNRNAIFDALSKSFHEVDLVILTGGLGPTKDDITKKVLCEFFNTKLYSHPETLAFITKLLESRNVPMSSINRCQADVPQGCTVIPNKLGTAPCIWMEREQKVLISLPGVPFEMEALMINEIIPRLKNKFHPNDHYLCKIVQTTDIGESTLSDLLEPWELNLPNHIGLAYLPQPGIIRLRLTGYSKNQEQLEKEMNAEVEKLQKIASPYIFSLNSNTLEQIIATLLVERNKTLSLAESCTGGYIAHLITSISGSSQFFKGSMVSYANEIKEKLLEVPQSTLDQCGAVSEAVVVEMAENAKRLFNTDYAIATSGIAGPTGGTFEKPVGTVWIAVSTPEHTVRCIYHFGDAGGRQRVITRAAVAALNMLRKEIAQ